MTFWLWINFIICSLWIIQICQQVHGWQCPANEDIQDIFGRPSEKTYLRFQTNLIKTDEVLTYIVTKFNNSNLYIATFFNNVLQNSKSFFGSEFIGDATTGNFTVKSAALQSQDGGTYFLQYRIGGNNFSTVSCLMLYVIGKPQEARISQDNNNVVGRNSHLICNSLSTTYPTNHTLSLKYNWKVNDVINPLSNNNYNYSSLRKQLTIKSVSKEDANTRFTCSATESGDSITGLSSDESDQLIFQVIYGPDADTTKLNPPNTQYTLNEGGILNDITCSGECYPSCNFKWTKSGTQINNGAVLSIGTLFKTDAALYTCEVTNSNTTEIDKIKKEVKVNVIFGPDASTTGLTPPQTFYTLNEGTPINSIRCSSDCYPTCTYKWTKTGNSRLTSVNNANLSLGSISRDEAGTYICTVRNPASKQERTLHVSVIVIFGPDANTTSLTPTQTSYTLNEGSPIYSIRCSSECYPACTYKWTKKGNSTFSPVNNANLSLGSISRDEAGTYICTVSNPTSIQEQTKSVSIIVIYGPDPDSSKLDPSQTSYTENERSHLNDITCSTACYPACTYKWTKAGSPSIDSNVLSLGTLSKEKAATYTCTAYNPATRHSISTSVIVHVRFGPTSCSLNVHSPIIITEGVSTQEMTCQAECYPECTYSWTNISSNSPVGTNGKFQMINTKRYEAGLYKCLCANKPLVKSKSSILEIVVHYPPDVTVLQSTTNFTEGNNLTLTCDAKGVPSDYQFNNLTQVWNGVLIPNTNSEKFGTPKHSSLYIPSLQLQDSGTYTCYVNNGVNTTDSTSSVYIKVKGVPKVLTRSLIFKGQAVKETNVGIQFYSFPTIQDVVFKRYDGQMIKNDTTKGYVVSYYETMVQEYFYGKEVSFFGLKAKLIIKAMLPEDFGGYTLILKNQIGEISTEFEIKSEKLPSIPKFLYYIGQTNGAYNFIFIGGYNGGSFQTFVIETRKVITLTWTERLRFNETNTTYLQKEQNEQNLFRFGIQGLVPGEYEIRVLAGNKLGWIAPELAPTIQVTIYEHETREQSDEQVRDDKAAIVGGSLSFVILTFIVVGGVYIVRNMTCKKAENKSDRSIEVSNSSTYDNLQMQREAVATYSFLTPEIDIKSDQTEKMYENVKTRGTVQK